MAIQSVTKPMALDETLQATNTALGGVAKDTTLGGVAKDTTLQGTNGKMDTVITKLQGIIDALGVDTSVYKAAGNKTCAELLPALLVASNLGNVYNITDTGTTTSDFVEGSGKPIHVGDNVAIVDIGTGGSHVYKFDLLAGMVDLTNYVQKSSTAGLLKNDGTVDTKQYVEQVSGKGLSTNDYTTNEKNKLAGISANANKVESSSTNGNIKIDSTETQVYDDSDLQAKTSISSTTVQGNPISFNTLSAQNSEATEVGIEPIQDLHGYSKPWVGGAGKNLLPLTIDGLKAVNTSGTWTGNTYVYNGVTFTVNTDNAGNITAINVNRTSSNNNSFAFLIYEGNVVTLPNTCNYTVKASKNSSNIASSIINDSTKIAGIEANELTTADVTMSANTFTKVQIYLGYQYNDNITFYPMIRLVTETDATFEPYENLCPIFPGVYSKNLLITTVENLKAYNTTGTWSGNTYTLNNCVYTIVTNDDGKVSGVKVKTIGTVSENTHFVFTTVQNPLTYLNKNTYFISGLPSGTTSSIKLVSYCSKSSTGYWYDSIIGDSGLAVTVGENNRPIYFGIRVYSNASISTDVLVTPMIEIGSSKTDFEPYDTHKIEILGCGKNLFEIRNPDYINKANVNISNNTIKVTNTNSGASHGAVWYKEVVSGKTYTLSAKVIETNQDNLSAFLLIGYDNTITNVGVTSLNTRYSCSIAIPSGITTLHFGLIPIANASGTGQYATFAEIQVEENSQDTAYESYNLNTNILLEVGQDVYGGKLDVETGVLTVDRGFYDLGNCNWIGVTPDGGDGYVFYSDTEIGAKNVSGKTFLCEAYNAVENVTSARNASLKPEGSICGVVSGTIPRIYIKNSNFDVTDASGLRTSLIGVKLVYPLATPLTIQLTPNEIALLQGANYLSTNCQNLKLTYRTGQMATLGDLLEVEKKIPSATAQHNYSTTEQVIGTWIDGKLIYEKTVHTGEIRSTIINVAHNISNIDKIIKIFGYAKIDSGIFVPLPFVQFGVSAVDYQIRVHADTTNISLSTTNLNDGADSYVTLQYTKTTD